MSAKMLPMRYIVNKTQTVLDALSGFFPKSSKNTLRSWLEKGRICVEGRPISKASTLIEQGKEITLGKKTFFIFKDIEILYQDEHVVVLHKPAGLLSVATDFDQEANVHSILKEDFRHKRVFPVHRLDRDTSGVMMFAHTELARDHLKAQLAQHSVERHYFAIVEGKLEKPEGTWQSYLNEDITLTVRSGTQGKLAITRYETLFSNEKFSLLRLTLKTGRKNQIRVHCQVAGHPIVGDKKYGSRLDPVERMCLHAAKLGFVHPVSQKLLRFSVPIPEVFYKLVDSRASI